MAKTREEWVALVNSYLVDDHHSQPNGISKEIRHYIENLNTNNITVERIKMYEKEFENIMNTGNSFKEKMVEQAEKFGRWTSLVTNILKNSREVRNDISALNELDSALDELNDINDKIVIKQKSDDIAKAVEVIQIDLTKNGFDLSRWEGSVKPVKAFLTLKECKNNEAFKLSFEICDMMFLMEDGTFERREEEVMYLA